MATIAKAMITLTNVNDAYSVVLSPDSCVIKADFDGTNPNLDAAFTDITVMRGETKHTYKLEVAAISNSAITYELGSVDAYTKRIKLTNVPADALSGYLSFTVSTDDDYVATVTFQYSVVRETSMLDWILDWENNKTKIGDDYLITPKLFVGKKVENADGLKTLTGVYIGPDSVSTDGIYGYKEGEDIFHINANGAMIGGWEINKAGISTSNDNGYIKLLSDGNISYSNVEGDVIWQLFANGDATFAKGKVSFSASGDASFDGMIQSESGSIAGWTISSSALFNEYIRLDSASRLIGVCGHQVEAMTGSDFISAIYTYGGVYMNYMASGNYGLRGYLPGVMSGGVLTNVQTFALGSENKIANWYFDNNSLYMGDKVNMTTKYTNASSHITIGSQGLRGSSWYIDNDGSVSFAKGLISFTETGGSIVGWGLQTNRLDSTHVALVSDSALAGIYLSKSTNLKSIATANLKSTIKSYSGIYLCTDGSSAELYASDSNANQTFYLTTGGTNKIANWYFDKDAIYSGTKSTSGYTSASGSITIGGGAIRGYKWKLEDSGAAAFCGGNVLLNSDGSGSLASGNISWDKSGNVSFSNTVKLTWQNGIDAASKAADAAQSSADSAQSAADSAASKYSSLMGTYLTYIGSDGIYTGTLAAENIKAGTISSCSIQSSSSDPTWKLNSDGSGSLASGNISWDKSGNVTVEGTINATSGEIGDWYINNGKITSYKSTASTNYIKLDATSRLIELKSSSNSGSYDLNTSFGAILTMNGVSGVIQAKAASAPSYSTAVSYISSNGIFSNIAGTNGMPASSGYTHRGAIVGLGFANVSKSTWSLNGDETIVAGVYGRASNSGTAPAYGGFFYQLKACGFTKSTYYFGDDDGGKQIPLDTTTVIGLVNKGKTNIIFLPNNANEGQEVEIIQMGAGVTRIDTNDGTHIYDDTSENEYYDCPEGWSTICRKVKYSINKVSYDIWIVRQYKYI